MSDDASRRLDAIPDHEGEPPAWDPSSRRFADDDRDDPGGRPPGTPSAATVADGPPGVDSRRLRIAAPPEGGRADPPPRRSRVVVAPSGGPTPAPSAPSTRGADPTAATAAPDRAPASARRAVVPVGSAPPRGGVAEPGAAAPRSADAPTRTPRTSSGSWWPPSRRTVGRTLLGVLVLALVAGLVGLFVAKRQFDSIERVPLADVLASGDGTNYLIVGSDTREGISPDDPNAGAILGPEAPLGSERSDTILILRLDGDGAAMLSVPRDLLVTVAETGERGRINGAFNGGPSRLIATLTQELGLPIHHYLELDFVAFRDLVDALGGITIEFPNPVFDDKSGLRVEETGPVRLDGDQALAYVRSRTYTEIIDGREVVEPTGDIGRVQRQQRFLAAVVAEIGSTRNPIELLSVTSSMVDGMRIDDQLGFIETTRLALRFRGLDLEPTTLPTANATLPSGAQVLTLVQPGANEVLARFGSPGARTG